VATVPVERLDALRLVRLTPLAAGSVAGNRALGTVPVERLLAFRLVRLVASPDEGVPSAPPPNTTVPVSSGSVSVRFVLLLGEAIVNSPVPEALGLNLMLLMLDLSARRHLLAARR
jgi:hypothetical protein